MFRTYDATTDMVDGVPLKKIAEENRIINESERQRKEDEKREATEFAAELWNVAKFLAKAFAIIVGIVILAAILLYNIWAVVGLLLVALLILVIVRMLG